MLVLASARPASAQWDIIKWLEELSGPGHLILNHFDLRVGCRWKEQPEVQPQAGDFAALVWTAPAGVPAVLCDQNPITRKDGTYAGQALWKSVQSFFTVGITAPWFTGTGTNRSSTRRARRRHTSRRSD
jgi:hypothetical protein